MALASFGIAAERDFDAFHRAYASRVTGFVRHLGVGDAADDVVQETMLRAYRHGLHEDERDPWPWLSEVARNLCRDVHRGRSSLPVIPDAADEVDPERVLLGRLQQKFVGAALAEMPVRQRRLLARRYLAEDGCGVIAAEERTTVDAVKAALARARHSFRMHYDEARRLVPALLMPVTNAVRTAWARLPGRPPLVGAAALLALGMGVLNGQAADRVPVEEKVKETPVVEVPVTGPAHSGAGGGSAPAPAPADGQTHSAPAGDAPTPSPATPPSGQVAPVSEGDDLGNSPDEPSPTTIVSIPDDPVEPVEGLVDDVVGTVTGTVSSVPPVPTTIPSVL